MILQPGLSVSECKDSLIRTNVKLRDNDIIYIHNKTSELGFWNFPDVISMRELTLINLKYCVM
ncbi:hypothetical protein CS542_02530 [Pedobacter sp. IW39]|nr:hypothetical protein CS542_02530 [Pedobacter sp. IW39]